MRNWLIVFACKSEYDSRSNKLKIELPNGVLYIFKSRVKHTALQLNFSMLMKKTLHSRHHSTVLPRLGSSRMESHQNLHTLAVDSDIQIHGNNRVLKEHPPPISDEKQRLNRRQQCTLSQLRSEHCHQLQDYKHRVLGEPSDICIDCGASQQSVRHLFACTTHPTNLSPEDLWRIRWDQFVRLATSTSGTLTDSTTDLVVVNNNISFVNLSAFMESSDG